MQCVCVCVCSVFVCVHVYDWPCTQAMWEAESSLVPRAGNGQETTTFPLHWPGMRLVYDIMVNIVKISKNTD